MVRLPSRLPSDRSPGTAAVTDLAPSTRGRIAVRRMSRRSGFSHLAALFFAAVSALPAVAQAPRVTVFEGARLIVGDGSAPIENSAFVVEGNRITQVGRKG